MWQEIYARYDLNDMNDPVWDDLEHIVFGPTQHESGSAIYASAVTIDSSDGMTNAAVYGWVRKMIKKYPNVLVMAGKGSSSQGDPEIFSTPRLKGVDHNNPKKQTKADKYGLKVYQIGTNKAKDLLAGRFKLSGFGPGRHHIYKDVRSDYFDQVTGEVKAPHRTVRNKKIWQQKSGSAVEAWDCEVYALHAAHAKRVHLMQPAGWDAIENRLLQTEMFSAETENQEPTEDRSTGVSEESQEKAAAPKSIRDPGRSSSLADLGRRMNS